MHLPSKPRNRRRTLCLALLTLALPADVSGQGVAAPGTGFLRGDSWWSVTLSVAAARLTCDLCEPSRDVGPSLDVVVGAFAGPHLRVGLEGGVWSHGGEELRESVYRAGVTGQLHPTPGSGLHALAGVGWSGYRAGTFAYDAARLTVGAGWDFPQGDEWVVGGSVTLDAASFGSLANEAEEVAQAVGLSVVRFGIYVRRQ